MLEAPSSSLDDAFPDDERFADLLYSLAVYAPQGGEFLHGEGELVRQCSVALTLLS